MGKYQPFHDLDAETNDALRKSIARFGVVSPVVVDGNGSIIDGHQRARIAGELGLTYPIIKRAVKNDDDAIALALSLNIDRRQLDPEQRREIVADLRERGYSLRAIAGVVKVSRGTVANDVQASGVQVGHVMGEDGKTYAASQPERETPPTNVDPATGEVLSPMDDTATSGSDQSANTDTAGPGDDEQDETPAPSPAPKVALNPGLVLLADFSRLRADAAKWLAFDRHEQVIEAMTVEQRDDYCRFCLSMFNHASATIDTLNASAPLRAVQ